MIRLPLSAYLGIALVLSMLANLFLWESADASASLLQAETDKVTAATSANASQTEAITKLQGHLATCVGQADLIQELADQAKADLERARVERTRLSAERRASMEQAYADPSCADWTAGAVCAAVSDRL